MRVKRTADQAAGQMVEHYMVVTAIEWQERFADDCHFFVPVIYKKSGEAF